MFKELKPSEWITAINAGLEYRWIYGREKNWRDNEEMFYNTHPSLQNVSAPNIVMETGDSILSQLTVQRPSPIINARSEEAVDRARILETLDKDFVIDLEMRQSVETCTLHSFLFGVGIMKYGYDSEFGFAPQYDALEGQGGFTITQFDKKGNRNEFNDGRPGMPWCAPVSPHDFVVPWGTKELKDAPWCAHRVVRHITDVKTDIKYKTKNLQPTIAIKDFVQSYKNRNKARTVGDISSTATGMFGETEKEYVEIWEIHDRRFNKVYCVVDGHETFIRNESDLLQQSEGLPFAAISFIPRARNFWVTPDVDYLLTAQADVIDINLQMSKQRRLGVLKFLYSEDAIDPEEMELAISEDVGPAIRVNGGHSLDEAVKPFTAYNNNNMLMAEAEAVRRDARALVGFSRNQAGEFEKGRTTATEALVVNEASGNRMSRRGLAVSDLYVRSFKVINSFVFKFWTLPKVIQTMDLTTAAQWLTFVGADLKGDYSYEIMFTDAPIPTTESRKMEAMQLYPVLSQDPTVDQVSLRKYLARAFNNPEFTSIFNKELLADANVQLLLQALQQITGGAEQLQGNNGQSSQMRQVSQEPGTRVAPQGPNPGQSQRPV